MQDTWRGSTSRDNTLGRWAVDLQNDFRARLDWCVKPPREANHNPLAVVNGSKSRDVLHRIAAPGDVVKLSATESSDPDGDKLAFEWFVYPEAGTYRGEMRLNGADSADVSFIVPADAYGKTIHIVLAVRDDRSPAIAAYRRIIFACRSK